ncbi:N-6 DNA methylase [Acidithiobacillus ferriphilus]|uniref:N-6 DNA methylase n=1 Tax=Acidithiobacillus ferriphilus TaxID=1689834 RepID=UPI002DB7F0E7|nr:N-6 DNA methylase [Acidithiobacillus ferriphilus]MEB8474425.1 N-6 DNA methylase [Acidithiobacillus ferriphilus]
MLDTTTKRRIDTARDILVGKVPDPKSQVEQITIALIYKFMDDMDAESEELGGKRKFFTGDYARYGWAKLMAPSLGGHEMIGLYGEGIAKMPENPGIPPLFRDIFKNAYLPYRDPETLKAFLKIIDEFSYDHSERLGDAFEYLLSVLGSQGDAGQFRTPRHIIDFMVEVLAPQKNETILDPACGTAGFLISAYKHILRANTDAKGHSTLTPDDKGRLAKNFKGYDISPDMVRLSLVNLYLHGFTDPHIYEYDTLTSEERWNEFADVILANPPFMSPKGGIKPHKRFSIQAKRSEVLFVDYMAEHLTPTGRAGIIVPEGIIFQSQTAYKELRRMLVENSLVAVVSLPAGCFNPYSGVKTSILILDKSLARQSDTIAFFKVENDGFGLGAQRRAIDKNDLPRVQAELAAYLHALRNQRATADLQPTCGLIVPKEKIAANGDYNLSGERYRECGAKTNIFPLVKLCDVCTVNPRKSQLAEKPETRVSFVPMADLNEHCISFQPSDEKQLSEVSASYTYFEDNDVLLAKVTPCFENGKAGIARGLLNGIGFGSSEFYVLRSNGQVLPEWVYFCVMHPLFRDAAVAQMTGTGGLQRVPRDYVENFQIPLPPLAVQKEIVAEIEGYQKVINGARAVLDHYRPHIPIHPDWPMVELREIIDELESGVSVNSTSTPTNKGELGILKTSCVTTGIFQTEEHKTVVPDELARVRCPVRKNTIIISRMNTEALVGANAYVDKDYPHLFLPDRLWQTVITRPDVEVRYLQTVLASDSCRSRISAICGGTSGSMKNIAKPQLLSITVPLPSLATQRAIVAEIEAEQALVAANSELITRFEQKIQATLARVWGADEKP